MIDFINYLLTQISNGMSWAIDILPDSPFKFDFQLNKTVLGYMNYFLPLSDAVAHLIVYIGAVAVYYSVRVVLRWLKVANS